MTMVEFDEGGTPGMALHQRLMMKRTVTYLLRRRRGKGKLPILNQILIMEVRIKT